MLSASIRSDPSFTRRIRNPAVGCSLIPNILIAFTLFFRVGGERLRSLFQYTFVVLVLDVVEFAENDTRVREV